MARLIAIFLALSALHSCLCVQLEPTTLLNLLETKQVAKVNILVSMTSSNQISGLGVRAQLRKIHRETFSTRGDRINSVANTLKAHAQTFQKNVLDFLTLTQKSDGDLSFKQIWLTNQIIIKNVDLTLMKSLTARSDIFKIEQETFFYLNDPEPTNVDLEPNADDTYQWGVAKVNAPAVYNVTKGEGIVVAILDTGVRYEHEALQSNYRKENGWFDASSSLVTKWPYDDNGHGTHCAGTIVGTTHGIGVSPGSQWIACKASNEAGMFSSLSLVTCFQWVTCPTDVIGGKEDCSLAPHVVSNSWAGQGGSDYFNDVIAAWRAAWIVPVFGIGNSGELGCSSAGSPGDNPDVISVGSTTVDDKVSYFSSRGPALVSDLIVPTIVAPGSDIYSANYTQDDGYVVMSGTSMATPHVSGIICLMLSHDPTLDFDQIKDFLIRSAIKIEPAGETCGGIIDDTVPNNQMGYGRVDAYRSVFPKGNGASGFQLGWATVFILIGSILLY